ncbi:PF02656 domain-containing protein [Colletotrichum musicola]|uniref:PF02656 domain-containing protein n=1 Tax=Colletotrichum musicola TaxID=2175873 RepID=A0A8H6NQP5_9PEZI|nr:PF02656 domain-containing protein [Colletotrichum musicola]
MAPARDDTAAAPPPSAVNQPPFPPPSSDSQQAQSPSSTTPPPPRALSRRVSYDGRSPTSPRSLSRRQSTNERINEILETARGRAEAMGGALSASRSAPASPPRQHSREDGTHDETVGIISRGPDRNYQSMNATSPTATATGPELTGMRPRKSAHSTRNHLPSQAEEDEEDEEDYDAVVAREERERAARTREPWYTVFLSTFQSIELENKGSVARDHLALERTFLAWLRTSLAFASIGIAVTQLFRLNSSISDPNTNPSSHTLRQLGKPLGATFLGISILILFLGYQRYFRAQQWVMKGKFPASRGTIIVVSLVAFALMAVSLVVVVVVGPTGTER